MTFFESKDNNIFEENGVCMEILEPGIVGMPIPQNQPNVNVLLKLYIGLTNNKTKPFFFNHYGICIPELFTANGQSIKRKLIVNQQNDKNQINILSQKESTLFARFTSNLARQFGASEQINMNYLIVESGWTKVLPITTRLSWQNNQLRLEVPTTYFKFARPESFWLFDALSPGIYQLRFIYDGSTDIKPDFDKEILTAQKLVSEQLVTPFVNLHFVQPVESNHNAVEVEGIRFETLVPQRVSLLPEKKPDAQTSVQLGISITNNTLTPFRFSSHNTLTPELVGEDGKTLAGGHASKTLKLREFHFPLIMPGENVTFFTNTKIFWQEPDQFTLSIRTETGDYSIFQNLNPGIYKIRFTYSNKNAAMRIFDQEITDTKLVEGLWIGRVSTPFIELRLTQQ